MRILITGASRGLGEALAQQVPRPGDDVFLVSRSRPPVVDSINGVQYRWLPADLRDLDSVERIAEQVSGTLDIILHNAGIWEENAFSRSYDFSDVTPGETQRVIAVNLTAPIMLTHALVPHLRQSSNPKILLMGSINGLENTGLPEVAYGASKWGLRGVAHTLRESLRLERIGVTILHPGTIGENIHDRNGMVIGSGIPYEDIARIVRCIMETSRQTVIKEIIIPAMLDQEV